MTSQPLSEKLRPESLAEIYGQEHLLSEHGFLTGLIKSGRALSIILWGPPGCGKDFDRTLVRESLWNAL